MYKTNTQINLKSAIKKLIKELAIPNHSEQFMLLYGHEFKLLNGRKKTTLTLGGGGG